MPLKLKLLWPFLVTLLLPLAVAWFVYPDHLPPGFGTFPPVEIPGTPGFNWVYFTVLAIGALGVTALILFPALFGFTGAAPLPKPAKTGLPWWFWVGAAFMLVFWWLMWSRSFIFGDLVYFSFSPMWWGFIIMLDGIVYARTGGKSLVNNRPALFITSTLFSVVGWLYFEYFDYFVLSNWFYPNGVTSPLSHATVVAVFLVAYSTVWPAIFEWYTLFNSFPKLVARYQNGPELALQGRWLIIGGVVVIAACVAWPYPVFWGLWIGPLAMIVGQLMRLGIWTPMESVRQGNWAPAILIALASLFNGFLWEFWNHGSEAYNLFNMSGPIDQVNPNYWIYDVPYVNVIHLYLSLIHI